MTFSRHLQSQKIQRHYWSSASVVYVQCIRGKALCFSRKCCARVPLKVPQCRGKNVSRLGNATGYLLLETLHAMQMKPYFSRHILFSRNISADLNDSI